MGKITSAELNRQVHTTIEGLAQAVDQAAASQEMISWLGFMAKFHDYSFNNTLLIYSQRPTATHVAGYKTWQKLGRQVHLGEKGIAILAPCPWEDKETGKSGCYYKTVYVFDVSQTDGDPLPESPTWTSDGGNADPLVELLAHFASGLGLDVMYEDTGEARGYIIGNKIVLKEGVSSGGQAKTLAHEIAHHILHSNQESGLPYEARELEAEAVAYVVATHCDLEADLNSANYIALWHGDGKALQASAERIASAAGKIIEGITV